MSAAMRIEKRDGREWLVGANGPPNDCEVYAPDGAGVCTRHFNGEHISGGDIAPDGAIEIDARWPIEETPRTPQPRDLAGRIRALVMSYADRWLDSENEDELANSRATMQHLRQAYRVARKGFDVDQRIRERIEKMRDDTFGSEDPVSRAADELETIMREHEEETR